MKKSKKKIRENVKNWGGREIEKNGNRKER